MHEECDIMGNIALSCSLLGVTAPLLLHALLSPSSTHSSSPHLLFVPTYCCLAILLCMLLVHGEAGEVVGGLLPVAVAIAQALLIAFRYVPAAVACPLFIPTHILFLFLCVFLCFDIVC